MFDSLDTPYPEEIAAFGEHGCFPARYEHGKEVLVAVYEPEPDSDGITVRVYAEAWPARFYMVRVLEGTPEEWSLNTGSGMAEFAAQLAEHISTGMLARR